MKNLKQKRNHKRVSVPKVEISEGFTRDLIAINDFWIQNQREIIAVMICYAYFYLRTIIHRF